MTLVSDPPLPIRHLPAIGLEELIAIADLQTRRDRKYLVPRGVAHAVLADVRARALEIEGLRTFRYESIYFDTPRWDSYLGAARRRPRRFKVRTRTYLDSAECLLEVKVRDHRGNTVKHRHAYDHWTRRYLTTDAATFVEQIDAAAPFVSELRPVLNVTYRRSTLLLDGSGDRVTVDRQAAWAGDARTLRMRELVLIETKTVGPPCEVDRALWRTGHRPVTISKYCTGIAALERDLPSNKWHRVLTRDLQPHLLTD